jgi:hypothetical protein
MLAGCKPSAGDDDYTFDRKEFVRTQSDVRFVAHRSLADLRSAAPADTTAATQAEGRQMFAWSRLSGVGYGHCEVHYVDPAVSYQPEWIGHELMHCAYGRWHP